MIDATDLVQAYNECDLFPPDCVVEYSENDIHGIENPFTSVEACLSAYGYEIPQEVLDALDDM